MEASGPDSRGEFLPNERSWLDQFASRADARWAARQIRDFDSRIYRTGDRYRFVEPGLLERIQPYARRFIQDAQRQLEAVDFRHVGDVEDQIANRARPRVFKRAFIRTLLDRRDLATMAGLFCVRLTGVALLAWVARQVPRTMFVLNFETELSDGRFLATENGLGVNTSDPFPGIIRRQLRPDTPLELVLFEHRRMLEQICGECPGLRLRPVRSPRQLIEAQQRMADLKSRHREHVGHLTASEIRRSAGGKVDRSVQMLMEEAARDPGDEPSSRRPRRR